MAKIKKIPPQLPLVISGYVLFALLIVAVLLSTTIPFARLLLNPQVLHFNVALFMAALTVGTFLPTLLGYVIGDHSIKSKSKVRHHFNGVLFGLLAFWLMLIFSVLVSIPSEYFAASPHARVLLMNLLPSIAVASITSILAIAHVRSHHAKHDILKYRLYSILLVGSIVLLPVWSLVSAILTEVTLSVNAFMFVPLIILMVLGTVSYATLRNSTLSTVHKVTWSAVSVSVAFVAVFVFSELAIGASFYIGGSPSAAFQTVVSSVVWVLALIGWAVFWRAQVASLSKKR